jgi:hypothetical protein
VKDRELVAASAGRRDQVRPMTRTEELEHAKHARTVDKLIADGQIDDAPNFRLLIVSGQVLDGPEHGLGDGSTLCGIPEAEVFLMRHLFYPLGRFACPSCAAIARGDPI